MSTAARRAVIAEHLKTLKLPSFAREYEARARQARDDQWDYEEYLRELLEVEVLSRQQRCAERRLREAQFPDRKTLDQIDWKALSGISKPKLAELASGAFLEAAEDVIFAELGVVRAEGMRRRQKCLNAMDACLDLAAAALKGLPDPSEVDSDIKELLLRASELVNMCDQ